MNQLTDVFKHEAFLTWNIHMAIISICSTRRNIIIIIIFIYFQLTLYNTWYEDNIIINNNYTISKLKECTRVIYYYTRKGGAFPVKTIKRLVHIYVKKRKKRKNKIMIIIKKK